MQLSSHRPLSPHFGKRFGLIGPLALLMASAACSSSTPVKSTTPPSSGAAAKTASNSTDSFNSRFKDSFDESTNTYQLPVFYQPVKKSPFWKIPYPGYMPGEVLRLREYYNGYGPQCDPCGGPIVEALVLKKGELRHVIKKFLGAGGLYKGPWMEIAEDTVRDEKVAKAYKAQYKGFPIALKPQKGQIDIFYQNQGKETFIGFIKAPEVENGHVSRGAQAFDANKNPISLIPFPESGIGDMLTRAGIQ